MIIVVGGEKGGTGKSTTAMNLAVYCLANKIGSVVLIDTDKQGSSRNWAVRRKKMPNLHNVLIIPDPDITCDGIREYGRRHDIVIVDVGGQDNSRLRTAMLAADIMVSPFRPSAHDIDTCIHLKKLYAEVTKYNPGIKVCAFFSQVIDPTSRTYMVTREALERSQITVLDAYTTSNQEYIDAPMIGASVLEGGSKVVKCEVSMLCERILAFGNFKRRA